MAGAALRRWQRKRSAALPRIRNARRVALAVAAAAWLASAVPAVPALAVMATNAAICTGTMTITFSTLLTATPQPRAVGVTGSASCIGPGGGTVTWSVAQSQPLTLTGCASLAGSVPGTITPPTGQMAGTMTFAGPAASVAWAFQDASGTNVIASGVFAWDTPSQVAACPGGISTMTLHGAFALAA